MALWSSFLIPSLLVPETPYQVHHPTGFYSKDALTDTENFGRDIPPLGQVLVLGALMGITWMCIFQVVVIGYTTFKRFSGLYFWSIFVATIAMTVWTLGVVLYHFILGNTHVWIPTVLITAGYLIFLPSKFLFILSRLHLLQPNPGMARFIKSVLILEYLCVEVPVNILYSVVVNITYNPRLGRVVQVYVSVGVVLLGVVLMTVSCLYLYLAWKLFGKPATSEVNRIFVCLFGGTVFLCILHTTDIILWFTDQATIRGFWLTLEFSSTLLVEFWILNHLSKLAKSTSRDMNSIRVVTPENQPQNDQSNMNDESYSC